MKKAGALVVTLEDLGLQSGAGILDTEWIPIAGRLGLVVLTKDKAIRHTTCEREAVWNGRVAGFWLVAKDLTIADTCSLLVQAIPRMSQFAQKWARPFMGAVSAKGDVHLTRHSGRLGDIKR